MKRGSRIRTLIIGLGVLTAFGLTPRVVPAEAATATTTFQVTATVNATCLISATNLAFGAYTGNQTDATSTVAVTCTNTTPYDVGLNAGTFTGATVTTRRMSGTDANGLSYLLSQDACTRRWNSRPRGGGIGPLRVAA